MLPIFLSSSDSYSDLWPIFFDLFKKYWPEYTGVIYLNTETLDIQVEGLDVRATKVGKLGSFGKVFRAGLDQVESDHCILMMIDYFIMGKVDHDRLSRYFEYFKQEKYDCLCLANNVYSNSFPVGIEDLRKVKLPSINAFSYQIAIWKRKNLYSMALPHETPWMSEWYGSKRANVLKISLAFSEKGDAIPYIMEGALHKGKWVQPMITFLNSIKYDVDFTQRGYYDEKAPKKDYSFSKLKLGLFSKMHYLYFYFKVLISNFRKI